VSINSDEVRRQLRQIDAEQRSVGTAWRRLLERVFDPESGISHEDKARVLGVPSRRQFLEVGGVSIAGVALLAACGDDDDDTAATTGTTAAGGTTATTMGGTGTTAAAGGGAEMDLVLARTAASLEALAVATYDTAATSGLVTTAAVGDAAKLFMDHHQQHLDALNGVVTGAGQMAVTEPNAAVKAAVVDRAVMAAKTEADIVALAFTLEEAAAQTYVFAATQLSTPALRATIMTIGGIEAQHRALLGFVAQSKGPAEIFPAAFSRSDNPLPAEAVLS
jgi:hypothetical protein